MIFAKDLGRFLCFIKDFLRFRSNRLFGCQRACLIRGNFPYLRRWYLGIRLNDLHLFFVMRLLQVVLSHPLVKTVTSATQALIHLILGLLQAILMIIGRLSSAICLTDLLLEVWGCLLATIGLRVRHFCWWLAFSSWSLVIGIVSVYVGCEALAPFKDMKLLTTL